jgi:hypothetical protein
MLMLILIVLLIIVSATFLILAGLNPQDKAIFVTAAIALPIAGIGLFALAWSIGAVPQVAVVEPERIQLIEPEAIKPEAIEPEAIESEAIEPEAIEPEAIESEPVMTPEMRKVADEYWKKQQMTPEQQMLAGIDKLTNTERVILDRVVDQLSINPKSIIWYAMVLKSLSRKEIEILEKVGTEDTLRIARQARKVQGL